MKICAAQTKPVKGDIQTNIENHIQLINLAVSNGADIIVFPELSLTGYEPQLAKALATDAGDYRLNDFQDISDNKLITIVVGMPLQNNPGITISMIIFQPGNQRQTYAKQYLHEDEYPYFINGQQQIFLRNKIDTLAPAICYEVFVPEHAENAYKNGATIYMASVAKSAAGVEKAMHTLPAIAKKYSISVIMSNCVGYCDNFQSAGTTSVWNSKGELEAQLNNSGEGIIIFDTEKNELIKKIQLP
ncbi:MAG: carbon-nitrogen hydrolase family protein [Panacibacter sp.]